ncbi:MAG: S26 family signal peptidase [Candidatus Saccharibacteria bacterium]|nr:S26 family signal peptidase [Candidatus Saccharibacteria bacterium]MCY4088700.1 S26 family signal peptidase [Candidatus Saccharibacteria bacterium]
MFLIRKIRGQSMYPTLKNKQLVVLRKTNQFQVGQIAYFKFQQLPLIKRIIFVSSNGVYLQGDHYQSAIYFVPQQSVEAVLFF